MILPMMCFAFALLFFGGLASLVALADPTRSRRIPAAFFMFFAGVGSLSLSLLLAFIVAQFQGSELLEGLAFFGGYAVGGLGGGVLGLSIASRRKGRVSS